MQFDLQIKRELDLFSGIVKL